MPSAYASKLSIDGEQAIRFSWVRISGLSDRYSKIDNFVFSQVIRFGFLLRFLLRSQ